MLLGVYRGLNASGGVWKWMKVSLGSEWVQLSETHWLEVILETEVMWLWLTKIPTDTANKDNQGQCGKWHNLVANLVTHASRPTQLVAKIETNANDITHWPNLEVLFSKVYFSKLYFFPNWSLFSPNISLERILSFCCGFCSEREKTGAQVISHPINLVELIKTDIFITRRKFETFEKISNTSTLPLCRSEN